MSLVNFSYVSLCTESENLSYLLSKMCALKNSNIMKVAKAFSEDDYGTNSEQLSVVAENVNYSMLTANRNKVHTSKQQHS